MKTYNVELASGFSATIKANNLKDAKVLASRMARGNDKVLSVKLNK
jgi:hypothetical protein